MLPFAPKKLPLIIRRIIMNALMGTSWYPRIRYRFRRRATTGTGEMTGKDYALHVRNVFDCYCKHLSGRLDDFTGLRILEIGPGEHLGIGLLFVAAGAEQAVCADRAREVRNQSPDVQRMYEGLRETLETVEWRKRFNAALASLPQCERINTKPLFYHPNISLEQATSQELGQFDLLISASVLEHVNDLRADMRIMHDLLNPGGWIAHCVDLGSHDRYESYPLEFLETPEWLWQAKFSNLGGPNRFRMSHYHRFLEEARFSNIHLFADRQFSQEDVARVKPRLTQPFKNLSDEDLRASVIFFCAQKPVAN